MINSIQNDFINDPMSKRIMRLLNEGGDCARFVGGCVRDSLINLKTNDIDIATTHKPQNIIDILSSDLIKVIPTGIDHGTVSVFTDTYNFEITTLRSDIETDGRHAKVIFTDDWEKDSTRRDFTINSIYLTPEGDIFDPQNGFSDLRKGNVKFIGNPKERIQEDYLRILRYFRFNAYYGNDKIPFSSKAIKACEESKFELKKLSPERIQSEFFKILISPRVKTVIEELSSTNILSIIFGNKVNCSFLSRMIDIDNKNLYEADPFLRLISIIYLQEINYDNLKMFSFSNKQKKLMSLFFDQEISFSNSTNINQLNEALYFYGKEICVKVIRVCWSTDLVENDIVWAELLLKTHKWEKPIFPIKAIDIMNQGVEKGPILGEILKELEDCWISSHFTEGKSFLLKRLKDILALKV